MRRILVIAAFLFLATAGAATAVALTRTITLKPGHCKKVSKSLRVCAAKAQGKATVTKTVTTTPPPTTAFSDGTYVVGSQVAAGRYETVNAIGSGGLCYWERLSGFSGNPGEILANGIASYGRVIVDILATDAGFTSSGCGSWTKVG